MFICCRAHSSKDPSGISFEMKTLLFDHFSQTTLDLFTHLGSFRHGSSHFGLFHPGAFHLGPFHVGYFHQNFMICRRISATVLALQLIAVMSLTHLKRWMQSPRFKPYQVVPKFKWNSAFGPPLWNSSPAEIIFKCARKIETFFQNRNKGFLSYFFVKKIPLSRRVGYVMDGSMG